MKNNNEKAELHIFRLLSGFPDSWQRHQFEQELVGAKYSRSRIRECLRKRGMDDMDRARAKKTLIHLNERIEDLEQIVLFMQR